MIKGLYEFARKWSEKGSVWMIADTHFGDSDCKFMDPGWISPEEQVDILKKYVHKSDTLLHLGDVGDPKYLESIPGYKVLVLGNHYFTATKFRPYFDEIYEGPVMISRKILLSHEPINVEWAFNIHGHDHNKENVWDDYSLNLAANVCGYTPVNLGNYIKTGGISKVNNIHRIVVNLAAENGA